MAALDDRLAARRALAACLVGWRGTAEQRTAVKKRLQDPSAEVRLRAAQGLLAAGLADGIDALIRLLNETPIDLAWQAEELLHWAAGKDAKKPTVTIGAGSPAQRKLCFDAWSKWWQEKPTLDLAERKKDSRPGLVLAACFIRRSPAVRGLPLDPWRLRLYGCDGEVRWESEELPNLVDEHLLPGGRLLLAQNPEEFLEKNGESVTKEPIGVTERDLTGKVLWSSTVFDRPMKCDRLTNGHIAVSSRVMRWAEVTPSGEAFVTTCGTGKPDLRGSYPVRTKHDTLYCWKNGLKTSSLTEFELLPGEKVQLLETARVIALLPLPDPVTGSVSCKLESLPGGNYLAAIAHLKKVIEIDRLGNNIWQADLPARHAIRVRRTTLLAAGDKLLEIDRDGKVLWENRVTPIIAEPGRVHSCFPLVRIGFLGKLGE